MTEEPWHIAWEAWCEELAYGRMAGITSADCFKAGYLALEARLEAAERDKRELLEHLIELRRRLDGPLIYAAVHGYIASEEDVAFGMAGTVLIDRLSSPTGARNEGNDE